MKVIYHASDLDGFGSRMLLKLRYNLIDSDLIGVEYGAYNFDEIIGICGNKEKVIVIDFCLQPYEQMKILSEKCDLTWIDHHVSSIKSFAEFPIKGEIILGNESNDKSALLLAWEHYYNNITIVPKIIQFLSDFDVWRHHHNYKIKLFQLGAQLNLFDKNTVDIWENLFFNKDSDAGLLMDRYIENGYVINKFLEKRNAKSMPECCFEVDFCGYKALAVNTMDKGSIMFDSVKSGYDILIPFSFKKSHWTFSMYSDNKDIDLSVMAKRLGGGGGHKSAAGFETSDVNFITNLIYNKKVTI